MFKIPLTFGSDRDKNKTDLSFELNSILADEEPLLDMFHRFSNIFKDILLDKIRDWLTLVDFQISNLPYSWIDFNV